MAVQDDDIVRITIKMTYQGINDVQNVVYYKVTTPADIADTDFVTQCADDIDTTYSLFNAHISADVDYVSVDVYNVTQQQPVGELPFPSLTTGGEDQGQPLPPQCAPIALFNTNVPRSQGRKFLPPLTEEGNDGAGTPGPTVVSDLLSWAGSLLLGIAGPDWEAEPGNWSALKDRFARWVFAEAKDYFATQRRRYVGSGS